MIAEILPSQAPQTNSATKNITTDNPHAKDIVLVGNGGSLKGSGKGSLIDSFGTVVRFNEFTTTGYAKDVGSKLDTWATNEGPLWHAMRNDDVPRGTLQIFMVPFTKHTRPMIYEKIYSEIFDKPQFNRSILCSLLSAVMATDIFTRHKSDKWASTGLIAVLHYASSLLTQYRHNRDVVRRIYLAGFDLFEGKEAHHYWGKGEFCGSHSTLIEKETLERVPDVMGIDIHFV